MITISHSDICDFARLTLLVYEYGKTFKIDKNINLTKFLTTIKESELLEDNLRNNVISELALSSPLGIVYKFYSIDSTDLQVGITKSEVNKRITVIFRGSESMRDWYYDLSILKTKLHDNVYVHSGFYKQLYNENMYENLKNDINDLIKEYTDYEIYITGHSLGAALATLFGYELARSIPNKVNIISFASPRVGNIEFKKAFDKKENLYHIRVTNNRDVVTAVPFINFKHVGTNVCLYENSYDIFYNYSYNHWLKYSLFNCWRVSDHSMDLYYTRLLKNKW